MKLDYQSYGSGMPLIVLHGLFGSRDNWHLLSRKWGALYHVFAVDQRNHGRSPHDDVFNYPVMAEDLKIFMKDHNLPVAHLLGHSMGGKTAMQFALTYPEKVERLIVIDMAPKTYPPHHDDLLDIMLKRDLTAFKSRQEVDDALAREIPDTTARLFLLKNLTRDTNGKFTWKLNLDAISRNRVEISKGLDATGSFDKPTLFIRGEYSDYIQDEDIPLIKPFFPRAQIVTVPHVGHWVHAEAPEEVFQFVVNFLGDSRR